MCINLHCVFLACYVFVKLKEKPHFLKSFQFQWTKTSSYKVLTLTANDFVVLCCEFLYFINYSYQVQNSCSYCIKISIVFLTVLPILSCP